jgi:hypothetical protein
VLNLAYLRLLLQLFDRFVSGFGESDVLRAVGVGSGHHFQ